MNRVDLDDGPDKKMAWHFGQPLIEQRTIESGHGALCLSSRQIFSVSGDERLSWLHSLTTQSLARLAPGQAVHVLGLAANGRIEHSFGLIDDGTTSWCWTEPEERASVVAWLESMKFWTAVDISTRDELCLWWLGREEEVPEWALVSGSGGIAGGRLLVGAGDALADGIEPVGQWAYEAIRIAEGTPRIGLDTDLKTTPNDLGLFGTALDKGCYPGQESVARVYNLGHPSRRLIRLLFDAELPEPRAGICLGQRVVGEVGTVAQHYELGPIGLGLVKCSVQVDADLDVSGIAAAQEDIVEPEMGEHFRPALRQSAPRQGGLGL